MVKAQQTHPIARHSNVKQGTANKTMPFNSRKDDKMKIDELLLLLKAGYSKDEIASMTETEPEKKPETEPEKKQETEPEKKPETEPETEPEKNQKTELEKKKTFDYDKLADTIISKMQANNRSANLDKNKNSTDDWLSQLSLKF